MKSNNKPKTTWNIVRTITKNKNTTNNITTMNVNNKLSSNPQTIVNAFNTHFLSVSENLLTKNSPGKNTTDNIDPFHFHFIFISHSSRSLIQINITIGYRMSHE
jgi:hypothetical protein